MFHFSQRNISVFTFHTLQFHEESDTSARARRITHGSQGNRFTLSHLITNHICKKELSRFMRALFWYHGLRKHILCTESTTPSTLTSPQKNSSLIATQISEYQAWVIPWKVICMRKIAKSESFSQRPPPHVFTVRHKAL